MMTLEIVLDKNTAQSLVEMAAARSIDPAAMAVRLIKRALHAARPRPVFDPELLKAYVAEHEAEELALAESDLNHRAALLAYEDQA